MRFFRCFLIIEILFLVFVGLACFPISAHATSYPLQAKYPEVMIYKAHTTQKVIALSFDDGPDQRFTPLILNILNKYDVKATFFLLGTRVQTYPDVAKRIYNEGHVIGNHTYWHPQLTKTGVNNMIWEIEKNEKKILSITNVKTNLFRAPYGALNEQLVKQLDVMGYRGAGWSVDSEDWKSLSSVKIKQNILNNIHPGAIILMHSAGHWTQDLTGTVLALNELIPYLKEEGYTFVTIPELWSIEHGNTNK
ncbi:polysaccharide deacetylase family protein [Schinkia azotoformans]|uniref:Chitooligosaccharide deacetylase n=1 Tax=Schinkia azotoformans LMG 9581 TaxID=1131731 RepID=K6D8D7_SCHAZ|nr:polysaccharide deacetylase family protein [Schinkia azotoformans]EKN64534.1 chitooligosaccharide deacetylase [Schinkia azotoformans LMG 9581]MEC1637843.1 polysaccharide deacetylase family protein [Schinkia azotoformans]MEC1695843.1 polysaccharide deacetylase family protein [Schinkia azotoformans]MEC1717094.1 polysaccharide deacetylase family protein [Schinkia azotoformans]MEC1721784.1 polysaccharide deacetylase family protein [Schinkia azotoformans]